MKLNIMSSNIWGDYFGNEFSPRALQLNKIYHKYQPDILGLQEMTPNCYQDIFLNNLSDQYSLVPVHIMGQVNYTPLLYKTSRFALVDCGWERFYDAPDKTKSLTWGLLEDRQTRKKLVAISLHFWYMVGPEHDKIRMNNAKQLCFKIQELEEEFDCPVFAFGDFNCGTFSEPIMFLKAHGLPSAQVCATDYRDTVSSHHGDPVRGKDGFYHGIVSARPSEDSLDHIICTIQRVLVKEYHVVTDQEALDATDHSPIFVLVEC